MSDALLKSKLKQLPTHAGCYLFKDARGKVIYVGKAKSLRSRVRNYFQKAGPADPKTAALVDKVADLDLLVTDNESEALILEANLVREYKPRYNITLKDDKRYPYLKVTTQEPYPRLLVVRRVAKDGATYFGPYTNVGAMRRTARLISRVFMIRSCNLVIPPPGKRTYRVCLDYFIKRCPGPCEFKISQEEYGKLIRGACLFLAGRSKELFGELQKRMKLASAKERFEEAALIRDQLEALTSVTQKQKVVTDDAVNRDVLAFAREGKDALVVTLQIRDGILLGRQEFHLVGDVSDSESAILTAFIKQYYLSVPLLPDEIFLPVDIFDSDLIAQWLGQRGDRRVRLVRPRRGEKRKLVSMAEDNAQLVLRDLLLQRRGQADRPPAALVALAEAVVMESVPRTVVAFDISHLGEESAVGACVYFDRGQPRKSEYRRFKVHSRAPDDYAAMREVVERYFKRRQQDGKPMPDLVLIDGGRGQLSSAAEALYGLGLEDMPLVGLAKRLDELVFPYESDTRILPKTSPALRLLQRLRDEAHRFANTYQQHLSRGRLEKSFLDEIPGVGPARKMALIHHFGSPEGVRKAALADLAQVPGMGHKVARTLYHHLHPEPGPEPEEPA